MPKKKAPPESQEAQSERFRKAVSDAVAAGELSPTEADDAFDNLMKAVVTRDVGNTNEGR